MNKHGILVVMPSLPGTGILTLGSKTDDVEHYEYEHVFPCLHVYKIWLAKFMERKI
jgi:hypothetical protein